MSNEVTVSGNVSVIFEAIILGLFIQCAGADVSDAIENAAFTFAQIEICEGAP